MKYAEYIDYTNLKADATIDDIKNLCNDAIKYHFASVCVNPCYVSLAKELLDGTTVNVGTVVGFPLGANTIRTKEMEALIAVEDGADEIDMVINIGALKNGDYDYVRNEIEDIMAAVDGKVLKVIIETCYLTDEEIGKITEICNDTYVNFIKTSTGYGTRGVSLDDIDIINAHKNDILEIKASGGIRSIDMVDALIQRGVTRIGVSNIDFLKGDE
jgi:deoxyribose-phosphate aldolase